MINNLININNNKKIIIVWGINQGVSIEIKQDNNNIKLSCLERNKYTHEYNLTIEEFDKFLTINNPTIEEELFIQTFKILESFNNDSSQENKQLSLNAKPSLVHITNFFSIDNIGYEISSSILPSANPTENTIINLLYELDNNNERVLLCNKYYGTDDYNEPKELIEQRSKLKIFKEYNPIIDHFFNKTIKINNSFSTVENDYDYISNYNEEKK